MNKIYSIYQNRIIKYAVNIILALLAIVSIVQGARNAAIFSQDFQYDAAKVLALRINPYLESLSPSGILDDLQLEEYYLQMEANQFPSLLMLLIPFTFLPPLTARFVWLGCNIIFTLLIVILLRKTFLKEVAMDIYIPLMLLMIAGTPYRNQLGVGQHTLFAFTFFLLAVYFSETSICGKKHIAGKQSETKLSKTKSLGLTKASIATIICLTICYFKYTLTVPLVLYFIYKKKYKEIGISVLIHVILTEVAALWLNESFINMIIQPLKVSSALAAEGGLDFGALLSGSKLSFVLAFLVMIFLFVLMLKAPKNMEGEVISLLTLWSLIITYHRTYDFFVIVIVAAFFYCRESLFSGQNIAKYFYIVVLVAVFFVLRIFSESIPSKIFVGSLYYIFTIYLTVLFVRDTKVFIRR